MVCCMSPFKIILVFVITAALGFLFISRLSVDLLPNTSLPVLTITYSMQDAPPGIIENQATGPLENALSQISQIKKIYSVSGYGQGSIEITFDRGVDIPFKKFEVSSAIRQVYKKLNEGLNYPVVEQHGRENKSKNPLLLYRINAKLAPFQIRRIIKDRLLSPLSQIEGVNQISIEGAQDLQLTIAYSEERLRQFGITSQQITSQLQTRFHKFYPGTLLTAGKQRFTLQGGQPSYDIEEVKKLMIRAKSGQYFTLDQLARVYQEESKALQYFRINGLNSVTLAVYADEGVNRLQLAEGVRNYIKELETTLPTGFTIIQDYDDTDYLKTEIKKNIFRSILSFGILIIFLLLSYRDPRHLLILLSGIFISLGLTAFVAFLLSINIHLYSIAGITISLGIIIDNSIVVLDHFRMKRNTKIISAVLGASFTTIMALMLVFVLPEQERQNLTEFCVIVSVAIASSIATAVFYTPALNTYFSNTTMPKKLSVKSLRKRVRWFLWYTITIQLITRYRKSFITLCVLSFGLPIFLLPTKWNNHSWYNNTIGSSTYQETIKPYADKFLGGALRPFMVNVYKRSGYREAQRTHLYVNAELPHGNTLEDMNRVMEGMENYIQQMEGVEKYVTQVFSGQYATISISFAKDIDSSIPYLIKNRVIARSLEWGGVDWNIYGVGQGFSKSSDDNIPSFRVEMKGYNYNQLELYAEALAEKLLKNKRIQNVNTNERLSWNEKKFPQMVLKFNQQDAINMTPWLITQLLEKTERGYPSSTIAVRGEQLPVYVQPDRQVLSSYELMETSLIMTDSQRVKLSSLAAIQKEITVNSIHKEDRQYIRVVGFEYFGSYQLGNEHLENILTELKSEMIPGYTAKKPSRDWNWDKAKRQYGLIIILGIGVYFIASMLFENLRKPFYIVTTIPLSFIGIFISFSMFDVYLDQGGFAAFILLGGLVVNSSIYIVNDLNRLSGKKYNRYILKAVTGKMKPITLTIASTCLGLLPFIFGGQNEIFWFALAVGTTGGLLFSILVVFFALPIFLYRKSY